jgi:hypothetical protein
MRFLLLTGLFVLLGVVLVLLLGLLVVRVRRFLSC